MHFTAFTDLPHDIVRHIALEYLPIADIFALCDTSKRTDTVIYDNSHFWWSIVRRDLTVNPDAIGYLEHDGYHPRDVLRKFIKINGLADKLQYAATFGYEKYITRYVTMLLGGKERELLNRDCYHRLCQGSAMCGYYDIFRTVVRHEDMLDYLDDAASSFNPHLVRFIVENTRNHVDFQVCVQSAFLSAFLQSYDYGSEYRLYKDTDNLLVIDYLLSNGARLDHLDWSGRNVISNALTQSVIYVRYLCSKGVELPNNAVELAVEESSQPVDAIKDILDYLLDEQEYSLPLDIIDYVPPYNIDIVPYLIENGAHIKGCEYMLGWAISARKCRVVDYLLKLGLSLQKDDYDKLYEKPGGQIDSDDDLLLFEMLHDSDVDLSNAPVNNLLPKTREFLFSVYPHLDPDS